MPTKAVTTPDAILTPVAFPEHAFRKWLRRRQECRGDLRDEVWDGIYFVSPHADNEHQDLGFCLTRAIADALGQDEAISFFHGTNVSDRQDDWRKNFRIPDVAVFLPGNPAENRGSHWFGGPDFAVEVMSRGDRSRQKFDFYAAVKVRELLFVDRRNWRLELHRFDGTAWRLIATSGIADAEALRSNVLNLSFRLVPGPKRPRIEVRSEDDRQTWLA